MAALFFVHRIGLRYRVIDPVLPSPRKGADYDDADFGQLVFCATRMGDRLCQPFLEHFGRRAILPCVANFFEVGRTSNFMGRKYWIKSSQFVQLVVSRSSKQFRQSNCRGRSHDAFVPVSVKTYMLIRMKLTITPRRTAAERIAEKQQSSGARM
jgi:hypothetical protein